MAVLTNNAEGGADGVTPAISDTGSGDAFSTAAKGVNSIWEYTNVQAAHGVQCYRFANHTATGESSYMGWSAAAAAATYFGRFGLRLDGTPTASTALMQFRQSEALQSGPILYVSTASQIQIRTNAGGTVVGGTSTTALTASTWYRIEWQAVASGASSMAITLRIYVGDSTTITETLGPITAAAGGVISTWQAVRFGTPLPDATYPTATGYIYMDDLGAFDTNWMGPVTTPIPDLLMARAIV